MQPHTPADYTGTGAAVTLASILGINGCRWFQVTGITVETNSPRVGDENVSSTCGIPAGGAVTSGASGMPVSIPFESYDLTKWYVWVDTGDTISVGAIA